MSLLKDRIEVGIQQAELDTQQALGQLPALLRWLVILLAICVIPTYYIAKAVSHGIWSSRFSQGALTAKQSFQNPVAPKISNVSVSSLGTNQYAAVVQISNQNLDLSLENIPYTFTFLDSQKQNVYSYSGNLYLLPNETKYLTVPTFTAITPIAYTNFQLPQALPWQKRLQIPAVDLSTSAPNSFEQFSPTAFVVQGDFVNNSPYQLGQVRLVFILFDASNKIIGVSQRDEFTVVPFERRSYKQLWPGLVAPNLARVEVDAYTDTLDLNNLTIPDQNNNSSSDLSHPSAR